jgi:hypothetical protein
MVFKVLVLSTVLALSLGHHAALLCQAWCQHVVVAEAKCHEDAPVSAAALLSQTSCCEIAAAPAVFTTDVRNHMAAHRAAATLVSPHPPLRSPSGTIHDDWRAPSPPLERRPRVAVLRV